MNRFGELVDARAVRSDGLCGAGCLCDLFLGGNHTNVLEQHLNHSWSAMIFRDLLDPPQPTKSLGVLRGT